MTRKRSERLDVVKQTVLSRGSVTAQELANMLGTSRRTIYRYVDSLKQEGFAIEACPGSTGGFRLAPAAGSRGLSFSEEEAVAMLLAGAVVAENSLLPYNDHLESALERIRRSLSEQAWAEVKETMPNVSVLVENLTDMTERGTYLEIITDAIAHRRGLAMLYHSFRREVPEKREIDPYHLFYQGGAWYVVGYCHARKEVRTFRVDRIRELRPAERTFERPRDFSLYGYLGSAWGMVRGERHSIRIKFHAPVSRLIAESQWHPTQQIEHLEDGSLLFSAQVDGLEEIRRWVFTFAEYAEVLAPEELREGIRVSLERMANCYICGQPDKA